MHIGISTASFFGKSLTEDSFGIISSLGVDLCEVFLTTFSEYEENFARLLAERKGNLQIYSVHTLNQNYEPELFNRAERTRADAEAILRKVARSTKILGAESYTFHGPAKLKKINYRFDFDWIAERLNHADEVFREEGSNVRLAYENVHWTYFSEPEYFSELKSRTPVRACLDIKQARQSGRTVSDYINVMKGRISNVHLSDFTESGAICPPGKGVFDFVAFFGELMEAGYDGPMMLELYASNYGGFDEVGKSVRYLQKCLETAQNIYDYKPGDKQ